MLIYLAAPYSANSDEEISANVNLSIVYTNVLIDKGYIVINPLLAHYLHQHKPRSTKFWYAYDLKLLEKCDALFLVPGYEESKGVRMELKRAKELNLPIYDTLQELKEG